MPFIEGDVVVRQLDARFWETVEPLEYRGAYETFLVPAKFRTDFASVPRPFVWLLPSYGDYTKSAILHDYMLKNPAVTRYDADGLFRRSMRELGVSFARRWVMWAAVRAAARLSGSRLRDVLIWLAVAIPTAAFVIVPAAVILVWLTLFWLIEYVFYLVLRPAGERQRNKPQLEVTTASS